MTMPLVLMKVQDTLKKSYTGAALPESKDIIMVYNLKGTKNFTNMPHNGSLNRTSIFRGPVDLVSHYTDR